MTANAFSAPTADALPLVGKRVLIIDPFDASRSILRDTINQLGCKSFNIATGYSDALRLLERNESDIDLIFAEHNLNGPRDGQQLLEELRSRHVISLAKAFFMVTGERAYKQVVAVAEFAPDDYLLKPYSVEQLRQRIVRTMRKKRFLAPVYALIDAGKPAFAVEEALRLAGAHPEYATDCWRLAIDVLNGSGESERAEELLKQLVKTRAIPWAVLGLANIQFSHGRLEEAAEMLEALLRENPEFLQVRDTLAEIRLKLGQKEAALAVLEGAAQISNANTSRMRKVGKIAEALGDYVKAEAAFDLVLTRTRDTAMVSGEDYANLGRALVQQGKLAEAEKLAADQRRMMKGHKDVALSSALMEFHRVLRVAPSAALGAVQSIVDVNQRDAEGELSPRLVVQALRAFLDHGFEESGFALAAQLAKRKNLDAETRDEVREALDRHRNQQSQAKLMTFDEIAAAIESIEANGYDEELAPRVERSLTALMRSAPSDPRGATFFEIWGSVKAKYGMAA